MLGGVGTFLGVRMSLALRPSSKTHALFTFKDVYYKNPGALSSEGPMIGRCHCGSVFLTLLFLQ